MRGLAMAFVAFFALLRPLAAGKADVFFIQGANYATRLETDFHLAQGIPALSPPTGRTCFEERIMPSYDPYINGATADVLIKVVDDGATPVPGASVHVSLATGPAEGTTSDGITDEAGAFRVKGRTTGSVWIAVEKDGYYKSRVHPDIRELPDDVARRTRKWSDGAKAVTVVLRKIRSPRSLVRKGGIYSDVKYPQGAGVKGFDLVEFDWCAPYGKGKYDDLQFRTEFWRSSEDWFKYYEKVTITMTNSVDGMYFADVNAGSAYRYGYSANTNSLYQREIVFELDRRTGVTTRNIGLPSGKYIIFRTRTRIDENGCLVRPPPSGVHP